MITNEQLGMAAVSHAALQQMHPLVLDRLILDAPNVTDARPMIIERMVEEALSA